MAFGEFFAEGSEKGGPPGFGPLGGRERGPVPSIDVVRAVRAEEKHWSSWLREGDSGGGRITQLPKSHAFFLLFFFFLFFLYHLVCINQLLGTKTTCSAGYSKERTPSPIFLQPGTREKAMKQRVAGTTPTAHQPR